MTLKLSVKKLTNKLIFALLVATFMLNTTSNSVNAQDPPIELTREQILQNSALNLPPGSVVRWNEYKQWKGDVHDGNIPLELINDPVYTSMNLPSESRSALMVELGRDNAHILGTTDNINTKRVLGIGSVYPTSGATLPENFSIYLGKISIFAYSKSQGKWITLNSTNYPKGAYIYTLPWANSKRINPKNVTYYDDYIKIDLTKSDFEGNVVHFWGGGAEINKSDYLYYACAYDFWCSPNVAGLLTAVNGIDAKDSTGTKTINQLHGSRGMSVQSTKKTIWGNTIPNSEYVKCNTSYLNDLYNK